MEDIRVGEVVDTRRLLGLEYKVICHFKLAADMVGVASGSL